MGPLPKMVYTIVLICVEFVHRDLVYLNLCNQKVLIKLNSRPFWVAVPNGSGSYCLYKAILLSPAVRKLTTEHETFPDS